MERSKTSEYGNFLDLVDAAVRTPHDEIKAELEAEKANNKVKKKGKKDGRAKNTKRV